MISGTGEKRKEGRGDARIPITGMISVLKFFSASRRKEHLPRKKISNHGESCEIGFAFRFVALRDF